MHKDKVYTKEGIYFAFPFAMQHPQFKYALQNGYIDPANDLLPGGGREWFSVQQWVGVQQDNVAAAIVPVDAPLVALGSTVRGTWPAEFGERKGTILSYVMNNYWDTNYVGGQGGDFTFRYVVTSASALDPPALTRMGWEALTPLETDVITYQDKSVNRPAPLDAVQSSFLNVDNAGVVLLTWKQAEDHNGYILRFVEIAGRAATVGVTSPILDIQSAWQCSAMEENQQALTMVDRGVKFDVKPFEIVTVRVEGKPALASAH